MCKRKTWIGTGDFTPYSELLPLDLSFFSTSHSSGNGGRVATVFKSELQCCFSQLTKSYSSFELQLLELKLPLSVFVVYRPPKYNKDFIDDFADFLSGIVVYWYNHILICCGFNSHECCESLPVVRDFLSLIDSFDFI